MSNLLRAVVILGLVLALTAIFFLWRKVRLQERARLRLIEPEQPVEEEEAASTPVRPFVRHYYLVAVGLALVLAGCLYVLLGLPLIFAATVALVVGLLGSQVEAYRVTQLTFKIEEQLADAVDLMVASLRAGAGATSALENAAREARRPLRPQLDEMLGRIRYGEDPQTALRALEARVPLETFRLFGSALSVHWETGGGLAPTLATVGRVIRDRIEVNRRIRALSTQARASVVAVLLVTYFLAALIWRNDPDRMRQFLATTAGQGLVAGAVFLQAVGIVWSSVLSRLKY